jgi:carbamoylphosphate synthase small subunit
MRVGDLLTAYPELESVLIAQAPAFANLKNPVLRRTVAKVATLSQAARVGGIDARSLVRALRRAAGMDTGTDAAGTPGDETGSAPPPWYDAARVVAAVDADAMLARGDHPLGEVRRHVQSLGCHMIVCVDAGFVPAPLVDAFRKQGCQVATFPIADGRYRTAITRAAGPA